MLRLCLWFISALTIACILPIALVRAIPYDDSAMRSFLTPSTDCPMPCFLGIRPGVTHVDEALARLRGSAWISNVRMNASGSGYAEIRWDWSGAQSSLIDVTRPARITFYWDTEDSGITRPEDAIIETLSFYTHIRMYNAQAWFGDPDAGSANFRQDDLVGYTVAYHRPPSTLEISAALTCPMNLLAYWDAQTRISMSIGHITSQYVPLAALMSTC